MLEEMTAIRVRTGAGAVCWSLGCGL